MAGALLWVFFSKNAKLKKTYESLYRQFQTNLAVEERERNLRKQLQQQLENSRQEQDEVQANQSPDTPQQSESESDTQRTSAKYQSSRLGEEEKQRILAKLQDLCDHARSGMLSRLFCEPYGRNGRMPPQHIFRRSSMKCTDAISIPS